MLVGDLFYVPVINDDRVVISASNLFDIDGRDRSGLFGLGIFLHVQIDTERLSDIMKLFFASSLNELAFSVVATLAVVG